MMTKAEILWFWRSNRPVREALTADVLLVNTYQNPAHNDHCTGNFIRTKYDSQNSQLSREMEEYTKRQKAVSEVSALINRNHIAISTYKAQLSQIQSKGVVVDVKSVVDWLLSEGCSIEQDEQDPDKLLEVIDGSIATIDEKFFTDDTLMTREIASRLIEFLRKKVRVCSANYSCLPVLEV